MLQTMEVMSGHLPPLRPRRGPRPDEIVLMRALAGGPKSVTEGPIGRCVKRGWCRALLVDQADGREGRTVVVFALTEAGQTLIAEA